MTPSYDWATRWFGIRSKPPPPPLPSWLIWLWAFIGSFGGLAVIQAVFSKTNYFAVQKACPSIVASYGASAVLVFGVIDSPLAQPRSLLGGHFLSGLVGIIVAIIFRIEHLQDDDPTPRLSWLAASIATAVAIVVMLITKTTHPPAGATALLPIVDPTINRLRWYLLPVLLLSSTLLMVVGMITNNVQRRYPSFWISPPAPSKSPPPAPPEVPVSSPERESSEERKVEEGRSRPDEKS